MKIDLHIHSKNSDGDDTIEDLVPKIAEAGIDVFALTDHDRTDGWELAASLANKHGLSFIPGVEITTKAKFPPEKSFGVHLLAYLPDPANLELQEVLKANRMAREIRMRTYVGNLSKPFPELSYELVVSIAQADSTLGRPDIAKALVEIGAYEKVSDVWASGILEKGTEYYVSTQAPEVRDVIRIVRAAGGVPVIAHPLARSDNDEDGQPKEFNREHFIELVNAGLLGLETNHVEVTAARKVVFEDFARDFGLVTTGSSDYHGLKAKPDNPLGVRLTEVDQLRRLLELGSGTEPVLNHSL